jgi:hypothetical protein
MPVAPCCCLTIIRPVARSLSHRVPSQKAIVSSVTTRFLTCHTFCRIIELEKSFSRMQPLSPEIVWTSTFDGLAQQMRPCFVRQGTWHRMQSYLRCLFSPVERKNGWRIAEEIGAVTPYGVHYRLQDGIRLRTENTSLFSLRRRALLGYSKPAGGWPITSRID